MPTSKFRAFEFARPLRERCGESVRERGAIALMLVRGRVGDRSSAGQGEFQLCAWCWAARGAGLEPMHRALWRRIGRSRSAPRPCSVGAGCRSSAGRGKIDAIGEWRESMHEVDTRLFAVADDVDARSSAASPRGWWRRSWPAAAPRLELPAGHSFSGSASHKGLAAAATVVSKTWGLSELVVARRLGVFGRVAERHQFGPGLVGDRESAPSSPSA